MKSLLEPAAPSAGSFDTVHLTDAQYNGLLAALLFHEGEQQTAETYAKLHPLADCKDRWFATADRHQALAAAIRAALTERKLLLKERNLAEFFKQNPALTQKKHRAKKGI